MSHNLFQWDTRARSHAGSAHGTDHPALRYPSPAKGSNAIRRLVTTETLSWRTGEGWRPNDWKSQYKNNARSLMRHAKGSAAFPHDRVSHGKWERHHVLFPLWAHSKYFYIISFSYINIWQLKGVSFFWFETFRWKIDGEPTIPPLLFVAAPMCMC